MDVQVKHKEVEMPETILICGSRDFDDWKAVREIVDALPKGSIVVHGGARGADSIAHAIASQRSLEIRKYPAKWEQYGRAAGVIRNQQMLYEETIDRVVAFTYNLATSKGTKDMVERARKAGIPTEVLPN